MNYTMKKIYENPMLQVVGIKKSDIIATSTLGMGDSWDGETDILAPDRFNMFGDSWANAGY